MLGDAVRGPVKPGIGLLFLLLMLSPLVSWAQSAEQFAEQKGEAISDLESRYQTLAGDELQSSEVFVRLQGAARQIGDDLQTRKEALSTQVEMLKRDLQSLGEPAEEDNDALVQARQSLQLELDAAQRGDRQISALILRNEKLLKQSGDEAQTRLSRRLLTRTETISSALVQTLAAPKGVVETVLKLLDEGTGWSDFGYGHVLVAVLLIVVGALVGLFWGRVKLLVCDPASRQASDFAAFRLALGFALRRRVPVLLGIALAMAYLMLGAEAQPDSVAIHMLLALGVYFGLAGVINLLLSPRAPLLCYLPIAEDLSRRFARRLRLVLIVSLVAWVVMDSQVYAQLPLFHQYIIRAVFAVLWLVNGLSLVWLVARMHQNKRLFALRGLLSLAMVITLFVELLGYQNLSEFLALGLLVTYLSIGGGLLFNWLLNTWFDSVDDGTWEPVQVVKKRMQLAQSDPLPGMIWLRLVATLSLWGVALYLLALGWGLAEAGVAEVGSFLTDGFSVGSIDIVPSNLLVAMLIFVLGWQVAVWARQTLMPRWLKRTRLDAGTRNTVVTLTGYVGIFFAALIGLSVAGLDFSKLALIAGALSVGIGFGLQNIVNNFVSGLILLFERPIRVGDWVVIGDTEGYVRKISIRSTRIETFDRADIIVPNSDLISNNVTNWMLRDAFGRVIVPVGVAYGSDTELVKKSLLDVAAAHPLVMMNDSRVSNPRVIFRAFGASSLDFELRCFISDVESRLSTLSELNFAIDKAFRENQIEIPFPQQDVYIKSLPDSSRSAGEVVDPKV